jgi:hypothetical protein
MLTKLLGIISVDFDVIGQLLIREKRGEYNRTVHKLFIDFKKAYDLDRTEVSYKIST